MWMAILIDRVYGAMMSSAGEIHHYDGGTDKLWEIEQVNDDGNGKR